MYVLSAQFVNWAEPGDMRYGADHSPHDGNEKHNSKSYFFIILIASENMNMYRGKESDKKKTARIERHHHNSRTLQIPHRYTRHARNRIDVGEKSHLRSIVETECTHIHWAMLGINDVILFGHRMYCEILQIAHHAECGSTCGTHIDPAQWCWLTAVPVSTQQNDYKRHRE